ncbi:MAG: hypothetical protein U9R79_10355 [Armatimonadota bacterium]|nr:hypothetical protein [Armatimonadota bacterium]
MSVAINIKVNDGVVLAADTATTVAQAVQGGQQPTVMNIYNNANKVFNLLKGQPIGMISWGAGGIVSASIATLAKDLRHRFADGEESWRLDVRGYTMEQVAGLVRRFMFEEQYTEAFKEVEASDRPPLGFVVAGYSANAAIAEEYKITIERGDCPEPELIRKPGEVGITWNGQGEAIIRLVAGFSGRLPQVLTGTFDDDLARRVFDTVRGSLQAPLVHPAMPIQDAVDLADFLVDATIKFYKYLPGAPSVGGPIEIAAITKHEGFKWIRRKHYYSRELNPELGGQR